MKKIVLLSLTGVSAVFILTGCASYNMADAEANRYSVVETPPVGIFDYSTFDYTDGEGHLVPLDDCERPGLFEQRQCTDEYGGVTFAYSTGKGGSINSASITVGVTKYDMDCSIDSDDTWGGDYICVVTGEQEE